jgi:ferredoxin
MANPEPRDGDDSAERVDTLASDVQSADTLLQVRVDQDHCTGDGLCVQYAPQVFEFDVDGLAYVKDGDGELLTAPGATAAVPESLRLAVIDSADECPGDCIHVTDRDGTPVAGPAA